MKITQKLFLVCQFTALLLLPAAAQAQLTYTTNNGAITITGYTGSAGSLNIPDTISGYPVTAIAAYAFNNNATLNGSINISTNVTSIGDSAFNGCNNLTSIGLGSPTASHLTSIGAYAFNGCNKVNVTITIPNSVTNIGAYAFNNCYNLSGLTLGSPSTSSLLITIGAGAFNNCYSLNNSPVIPNTVTTIGDYAFNGCIKLPSLSLGSGLKSIGDYAFSGCLNFENGNTLAIPNSVTNIGAYAFNGCNNLSGVSLGTSATSSLLITIGAGAFNNCYSLNNSPVIPNTVTTIGDYAFNGCIKLPSLSLGSGLKSIGDYAFSGCLNFENGNTLAIPNSVTNIGAYAFNGCNNLSGVSLGTSATSSLLITIGAGAFNNCYSLNNSPVIPNTVTTIGDYAFNGCIKLPSLSLGSGLKSIGDYAFSGCLNFENGNTLAIRDSVTNVGAYAFSGCIGLNGFSESSNPDFSISGSVLFNQNLTTLIQYPAGNANSSYTVPSSVTSIADGAFSQCDNLTNVTIPASVTNIGEGAFATCTKLIAISVAASNPDFSSTNGVLFDKNQAELIQYPAGLVGDYTVPISVTSLGDFAFDGCTGLGGVYFQGNAPALGMNVFTNVNVAATVYYLSGMTGWSATYGGLPAVMLVSAPPAISISNVSVQNNAFGFTITGPSNQVIVVDANTNLAGANWQAIQTNTLTGTPFNFNDAQWTNYPKRFYRINLPQ